MFVVESERALGVHFKVPGDVELALFSWRPRATTRMRVQVVDVDDRKLDGGTRRSRRLSNSSTNVERSARSLKACIHGRRAPMFLSSISMGMTRPNSSTPDFIHIMEALRAPARRSILAHVDGHWMTISELARELGLAASTVSHHVHVLQRAGLVLVERSGRETQVTARYHDHEIVIQRRPATYPVPVRVNSKVPDAAGTHDQG